jgi:hypothetical protein
LDIAIIIPAALENGDNVVEVIPGFFEACGANAAFTLLQAHQSFMDTRR